MNTIHGTVLGLAIAMGGWTCAAQQATIPFRQLERDAQLTAKLTPPEIDASGGLFSSSLSAEGVSAMEPSAAGFVRAPLPSPVIAPRSLDSKYFLFNGLHLGMAVFDVAMTQHCIADHHCREGNPLMPSSLGAQLSVNFAYVGYSSFVSYRLKKHRSSVWWISPSMGIAAHSVGVASGFVHK
jgi:hypothetical protein